MEIERKFLVSELPDSYETLPFHQIEQAYLCTEPVVRIRRQDDEYFLTYKGKGLLAREEYNLPLTKEAYRHLLSKADGVILTKKRYLLPLKQAGAGGRDLTLELDVFEGSYQGLILAEVEFSSKEEAMAFVPPAWLGEDVTFSSDYHNSRLSQGFFPNVLCRTGNKPDRQ